MSNEMSRKATLIEKKMFLQLTSINGQESVSGDLIVHVQYEFGVTRTFGPDLENS
jgi:hypothetical protein